jgi:beta-glucanase (GH16 family)
MIAKRLGNHDEIRILVAGKQPSRSAVHTVYFRKQESGAEAAEHLGGLSYFTLGSLS